MSVNRRGVGISFCGGKGQAFYGLNPAHRRRVMTAFMGEDGAAVAIGIRHGGQDFESLPGAWQL